jgi:CDP-paratose 2-epimerase
MAAILVTGASGLIGSEVCLYFHARGHRIHGLDNNQRAVFFGPEGDTQWNRRRVQALVRDYMHYEIDIRDRSAILNLIREIQPSGIIHAAAQPSHDLAASIPFEDFDTNAVGTLNLLEAARRYCRESPFIFMSSNKVYGDGPNSISLKEYPARWDYADPLYENGISETFPVDQSKHSLFGASKLAADVMVQEYGRYFGMPTCCLRGGCLTGPGHSGVELHGFLSYLVKCNLEQREYKIFGYKGKQVRDNIHSADVAAFMYEFYESPQCGSVFNLGGGKSNSCSVLEAFDIVQSLTGKRQVHAYVEKNRAGDHVCYYSDLRVMQSQYPKWQITKSLATIIEEIVNAWRDRIPER